MHPELQHSAGSCPMVALGTHIYDLGFCLSASVKPCSPAMSREIAWAYVHVCTMIMYSIIFPSLYCFGVIALWQQSSVQCQGQFGKQMIGFFFSSKDAIIFLCEIILCWSPRWHILFIVSVLGENFFTPQCFLRMENHNWISPCTHGRAGSVLQQGKCTLQDANSAIILVSCI